MENTNLPVLVEKEKAITKLEKNHPRLVNNLKRIGKVAAYALGGIGIATVSIGAGVIVPAIAPVAGVIGIASFTGGMFKAGMNAVFQEEKDLLFTAKRTMDNKLKLFQRADAFNKTKGLNSMQLTGLMTLNTLVGLERFKSIINTSKYEEKDGQKVYDQCFLTKTHSINLEIFKRLEESGYLKIDGISEKQGESSLMIEKIGIGNINAVKEQLKTLKDKEKTQQNKVDMHTIQFRLTDKKIDLVEMYKNYNSKERKVGDVIGMVLFNPKRGILSPRLQKKIGIEYDKLGRPHINYNAKESGVETFEKIVGTPKMSKHEKFRQENHSDIIINHNVISQEKNDKTINLNKQREER